MQFELSTSARSTRVWASDDRGLTTALAALAAAGQKARRFSEHHSERNAIDVGLGVDALGALGALADAGHTFVWRPEQPAGRRPAELYGVAVGPPSK